MHAINFLRGIIFIFYVHACNISFNVWHKFLSTEALVCHVCYPCRKLSNILKYVTLTLTYFFEINNFNMHVALLCELHTCMIQGQYASH